MGWWVGGGGGKGGYFSASSNLVGTFIPNLVSNLAWDKIDKTQTRVLPVSGFLV